MSEHAAVLFVNDAFYLAFANQDYEAMRSIWASKATVTCIHPGWDVLSDRDEVLEDGQWKMVHHQAGAAPPPDEPEEDPQNTMQ